jgi:hypothetical protein
MKDIITLMKVIKHMCLWVITGSTLYIALWFHQYESYIV